MDYDNRADHSSQRVRVIKVREEICSLLVLGVPLTRIQRRVGLDDMPKSTFHYHASRIAKANGIGLHEIPDESKTAFFYTSPQSWTEADQPVPGSDSKTSDLDQPGREDAKTSDEEPAKITPRKKRKFVQVEINKSDENDPGFTPSKWKDTEI